MSFPTNTENMLRYPEPMPMQHELFTDQESKIMSDFLNKIDDLPTPMMGVTHPGVSSVPLGDTPSQNVMGGSNGFQAGYGAGFEAGLRTNGYMFPVAQSSITIPANGYSNQNFQNLQNSFMQQPSYNFPHRLQQNHRSNGGLQHGGVLNNGRITYIKAEPSIPARRQRSPSPPPGTNGTSSATKQSPKRSNSMRRSTKPNVNGTPIDNKSEENFSGQHQLSTTLNSAESVAAAALTSIAASDPATDTTNSARIDAQGDTNPSPTPTTATNRGGRGKKGHHELLTEAEKKANHIASEQKRRQNIRLGFDQLVELVPTLSQCHRSEALILQKSVEYIQQLLMQKNELKDRVKSLQATLGDAPDHLDDSSSEGELDLIF